MKLTGCAHFDSYKDSLRYLHRLLDSYHESGDSEKVIGMHIVKLYGNTQSELQWILTNSIVSKDSDFGFIIVSMRNIFEIFLKYLGEMKKYVSKLILNENIIK